MITLNFRFAPIGCLVALASCSSSSQQPRDAGGPDVPARAVDCTGDCSLTATYTVSTYGFYALYMDKAVLSAPAGYQHIKSFYPDGSGSVDTVTCAPALPPCTAGGPVSACDIAQDLADPAVQAVLARSPAPFFGRNMTGSDYNAFSFMRDDGHGFLMEATPCDAPYQHGVYPDACEPEPPAITRLRKDLLKLDEALIASPECAALNVPLQPAGSGMM